MCVLSDNLVFRIIIQYVTNEFYIYMYMYYMYVDILRGRRECYLRMSMLLIIVITQSVGKLVFKDEDVICRELYVTYYTTSHVTPPRVHRQSQKL